MKSLNATTKLIPRCDYTYKCYENVRTVRKSEKITC